MARPRKTKSTSSSDAGTTDYRHEDKRTNIPPAKIASEGQAPKVKKARYHYSPHLPPELRFDPTTKADRVLALADIAGQRALTTEELKLLREALKAHEPWLEWATKQEQHDKKSFEVDPVVLHIHERVSAQAIVKIAARQDVQRDLFADPKQSYQHAVQFYRHEMDWANRLILGDSLQVMSSLAKRENLAGKVQMVYMDPPYGIKFASNFQSEVGKRDIKDTEKDLTREPETVRAYRDTWRLGVHSYLSYLRERLIVARELLSDSGSLFLQISDENEHRVRTLLDEVFGAENFVSTIAFQTTSGFAEAGGISRMGDHILWYAKSRETMWSRTLFEEQDVSPGSLSAGWLIKPSGEYRGVSAAEKQDISLIPAGARLYMPGDLQSQGASSEPQPFEYDGKTYSPGANNHWKPRYPAGLARLAQAGRIHVAANSIRYRRYSDDFPLQARGNLWTDTMTGSFTESKLFAVQTNPKVIERCLHLVTRPGDLVLDPTCGSGTTAYAAEKWGRRWVTVDTSRVAISIARQRVLTATFDHYALRAATVGDGIRNRTVPHITLKAIANNLNLDPIFAKYDAILDAALGVVNTALPLVKDELRRKLATKHAGKKKAEGKRAVTEADERRWLLPKDRFEHWTVPFDADPEWPKPLTDAVTAYRKAWRAKMDEVDACIAANAEQEELVDQPEVVEGVLRVSGPFTVEGVNPEELSLCEEGLFDGTPNEFELGSADASSSDPRLDNLDAYLTEMVRLLKLDGLAFTGSKEPKKLARLEALFSQGTGTELHAEGAWAGTDDDAANGVAVAFGPQYGPVTALQVENAIRAAKRYDELVIAGFSFAPEATAAIEDAQHPKLRVHQAQIRPDINPGMSGLLKDTPNSQLFTVFGQPEIALQQTRDGWVVTLEGVDLYDPVTNVVRSSKADKVAAWFLDSDFDGRCFCVTQAFFPNQKAWDKIAKALKSQADASVFDRLAGTVSLPFPEGTHKRIAVKVIDPRGNEVMAIRKLGK